eukprot:TRINITY_DN12604_c0_g1_i1.p3 TRINITY_DN12604_c0_g1~~TRINITY_DN12604_c0_g1_i1.p3  ORF type:complete len:281 (+),score=-8.94 TRINITY_DN12604_c0_g1_i1:1365-2207(+)
MGSGVQEEFLCQVVGRMGIVCRLIGKGELEHPHAGKPVFSHDLVNIGCDYPQVLGNCRKLEEGLFHDLQEPVGRGSDPPSTGCIGCAGRDLPVCHESPEVIDPHQIEQGKILPETVDPPGKTGSLVLLPAVQRVLPHLSGPAEIVRGNPGNKRRPSISIQPEQFRVCPDIGTIGIYIEGHVPDNGDPFLLGIFMQRSPLPEEHILEILLSLDLHHELLFCAVKWLFLPAPDSIRPSAPVHGAVKTGKGDKHGIVVQPPGLLAAECMVMGIGLQGTGVLFV